MSTSGETEEEERETLKAKKERDGASEGKRLASSRVREEVRVRKRSELVRKR